MSSNSKLFKPINAEKSMSDLILENVEDVYATSSAVA